MPFWMRALQITLTLITIPLWLWVGYCYPRWRWYALAPLIWLCNVLAFGLATLGQSFGWWSLDILFLNTWSVATRIYAVVVAAGVGVMALVWGRAKHDII